MSLENYLAKVHEYGQEIQYTLDYHDVEQLYTRLIELEFGGYCTFFFDNQKDIEKYLTLTRSQREQKKWVNHPNILLIQLGAIQLSLVIAPILAGVEYAVGSPYRDFSRGVVSAACELLSVRFLLVFPFDGYDSPLLKR